MYIMPEEAVVDFMGLVLEVQAVLVVVEEVVHITPLVALLE